MINMDRFCYTFENWIKVFTEKTSIKEGNMANNVTVVDVGNSLAAFINNLSI